MVEVQKPTSILRFEFINALTTLINESKLPPFVVEPILKDACDQVHALTQSQLEMDKKKYEDALNIRAMTATSASTPAAESAKSAIFAAES